MFYRENRERLVQKKALVPIVINEIFANLSNNYTEKHKEKLKLWFGRFAEKFKDRDFCSSTISGAAELMSFLYHRAKSLGYTKEALRLDKNFIPKKELKEVEVYSTKEVARILRYAHKECPIWLPNIALRCFVGLRTSEASMLDWAWIDVEKKRIIIPAKICKTRDAWVLQSPNLPDTVFKWLELVPKENRVGIIPTPPKRLVRAIKLPLKTNGFRHTFCTMHISLYGSADKTATLLKHKGTSMLYKHYLGKLVPEDEAKAYFDLTPQSLLSNP